MTGRESIIRAVAESIWPGADVSVCVTGGGSNIGIDITAPYGSTATLSYATLTQLADTFGTTEIDVNTRASGGGCDTCDYGATTTLEIDIRGATK